MKIEDIAEVAHSANAAYCRALGDNSQKSWTEAPEWQRQSAIKGVEFHRDNPSADPANSHEFWLAEKRATGWRWGPVKDEVKKEHPCFIEYDRLPIEQKAKDFIFAAIVKTLIPKLARTPTAEEIAEAKRKLNTVKPLVDDRSLEQKAADATTHIADGRRVIDLSKVTAK